MRIKPNSKPFQVSLGTRGEMLAARLLCQKKYEILEKNYRCPLGEIDIIAQKENRLFFYEVKTRRSHKYGRPEEAVGEKKQKKLTQLANYYIKENKLFSKHTSFGVVGVTLKAGENPETSLIENAFDVQDLYS